jgi:hypothetical protein
MMIDTNGFDGEIERELNRILRPVDGASIPVWRTPESGGLVTRILGGAAAAIGLKVLTGFAVVAFAGVGALAATEAATTGSLNPADWGQQVKLQVAACKAALTDGKHGIGDCVSAFAKQHGDLVSDLHAASGSRLNHGNDNTHGNNGHNGQGNGDSNSNGNSNSNSIGKGHGHGKPSNLPAHP